MADIFVSYASEDLEQVKPLVTTLEEQGWSVWWDRELVAGPSYEDKIEEALDEARCVVVVWSSHFIKSQWVRTEAHEGLEREILVPLLIDDVKPPLAYRAAQTAKMIDWPDEEGQLETVVDGITELLGKPTTSGSTEEVPRQRSMRSIAVLPFANMSSYEETGYFADGLSENILNNLAHNENIKVASRSASFQFTGRGQDPSIIGEKLKVAYLIEGSVQQQGDNLHITAQLIRTEDGFHVWSKSYERTLADGFEMQTSVATNIAYITQTKLAFDILKTHGWKQQEQFDGIDPVAVEHFMDATDEHFNIRLGEGGDFGTIMQFLRNAVETDTSFYAAYSFLTFAYYQSHRYGLLPLHEARTPARAAISRAAEIAPDNFDVQFQYATVHLHLDLDYARAEVELRQLIKRRPKWGLLHLRLARIALREGRKGEALRVLANALEFEAPDEKAIYLVNYAWLLHVAEDYEGALRASTQALKLVLGGPDRLQIMRMHAASLIRLGRIDEAETFIYEGWQQDGGTKPESYIAFFAAIGETKRAQLILSGLPHINSTNQYYSAMGYLALGDIDGTFKSILAGIENHDQNLLESLLVAEWWNPIRDDPRFEEMLELLDSKVTHTEQYLRDHNIAQEGQ